MTEQFDDLYEATSAYEIEKENFECLNARYKAMVEELKMLYEKINGIDEYEEDLTFSYITESIQEALTSDKALDIKVIVDEISKRDELLTEIFQVIENIMAMEPIE